MVIINFYVLQIPMVDDELRKTAGDEKEGKVISIR